MQWNSIHLFALLPRMRNRHGINVDKCNLRSFPSHTVLPCTPLGCVLLQRVGGHSQKEREDIPPSLAECCGLCTAWMERFPLCPEGTCRRDQEWKVRKLLCPRLRILATLAGCVTDVRGQGNGNFKKQIPGRVRWERLLLKWFYSSCHILLNKEYLIVFSQRSGNLCPYIHPKENNLIALRIGRLWVEGIWYNWNMKSICSPLSTTNAGSQSKVKVLFLFCSSSFVREAVVLAPGISSSSLAFHYICCFVCCLFLLFLCPTYHRPFPAQHCSLILLPGP